MHIGSDVHVDRTCVFYEGGVRWQFIGGQVMCGSEVKSVKGGRETHRGSS